MIVWLIDAEGPGEYAGVTDSETGAMADAEALMANGRASSARVELAHLHIGGDWMKSGYERTGSGWSATCAADGSVRWALFSPFALAAS